MSPTPRRPDKVVQHFKEWLETQTLKSIEFVFKQNPWFLATDVLQIEKEFEHQTPYEVKDFHRLSSSVLAMLLAENTAVLVEVETIFHIQTQQLKPSLTSKQPKIALTLRFN